MHGKSGGLTALFAKFPGPTPAPTPCPISSMSAVVGIESHFNANAHSRSGPVGLVQILPGTASKLGFSKEQLKNPEINLEAGATYLKVQEAQFHDNYLAVVAYNLGGRTTSPNKRAQHHAHAYAKEVMSLFDYFQSQGNSYPAN